MKFFFCCVELLEAGARLGDTCNITENDIENLLQHEMSLKERQVTSQNQNHVSKQLVSSAAESIRHTCNTGTHVFTHMGEEDLGVARMPYIYCHLRMESEIKLQSHQNRIGRSPLNYIANFTPKK